MSSDRCIADAYRRFLPEPIEEVLVSGGGARNPTLVSMIRAAVEPLAVRAFDEEGGPALLGVSQRPSLV